MTTVAIFLLHFLVVGVFDYRQIRQEVIEDIQTQARIVRGMLMALQTVYQQEFLTHGLPIYLTSRTCRWIFLKIDGSFVRDILNDPVDRAMVEAINQIAHLMGLRTIAEYVENGRILCELIKRRRRCPGIGYHPS
jgi:hypothetical protein